MPDHIDVPVRVVAHASFPPAIVSQGREALSRAARQVIQALLPTFLIVASGTVTGLDVRSVLLLAAVTALISLLKSAVQLKVPADAGIGWHLLERGVTAAAGAALGLVTIDGTNPVAVIHMGAVGLAAAGAAAVAVAMWFTNPPATSQVVPGQVVVGGEAIPDAPETP